MGIWKLAEILLSLHRALQEKMKAAANKEKLLTFCQLFTLVKTDFTPNLLLQQIWKTQVWTLRGVQ